MVGALRRFWADILAIAGLGCIAGSAYLVDIALGLFATGVALVVVAVLAEMGTSGD